MLSLGQLYTDDTNNDDSDDDDNDANDNDSDTQWTNHDCIGSLACMPNEPKTSKPRGTVSRSPKQRVPVVPQNDDMSPQFF